MFSILSIYSIWLWIWMYLYVNNFINISPLISVTIAFIFTLNMMIFYSNFKNDLKFFFNNNRIFSFI